MAYVKKTWKNRQVEYPGRRKLTPTPVTNVYDVAREEGLEIEAGDPLNAANLNDLESRVGDAIGAQNTALSAAKPRLITLTIPATGWAAATAPDWQQVTVAVPGLADGSVIDLQPTDAQLNQLSTDGVGIIRADNVTGACVIKCKDAVPTVAMTVQATITEVRA